jgi:hypothetical protein
MSNGIIIGGFESVVQGGIKEIIDFDHVCEDNWEVVFLDLDGVEQVVALGADELEELSCDHPLLLAAWQDALRALHEVAEEFASERRQMGMCDW